MTRYFTYDTALLNSNHGDIKKKEGGKITSGTDQQTARIIYDIRPFVKFVVSLGKRGFFCVYNKLKLFI